MKGKPLDERTALFNEITSHAARELPREACGVIVKGRAIPCRNNHKDPEHFFNVHEQDLLAVYEVWGDIDGMYHSHPNGRQSPSEADLLGACPGKRYLIAAPTANDWIVIDWEIR